MEFLKEILGDDLYSQVKEKIDAHNGEEANKDSLIKLANLTSGEYVGKGKYDALNEQLTGKQGELDTANNLIADMKKNAKGNEELQNKIKGYEETIATMQKEMEANKVWSQVKVNLLTEHCKDIDYATFKLKESLNDKGITLELDGNENIKGWDDMISGLKTQLPNQFGTADANVVTPSGATVAKLPAGNIARDTEPQTLADALKMKYES